LDNKLLDQRDALLKLSHDLGREDRGWAILGEGNASARIDGESFLVKASGSNLGTLRKEEVVQCKSLQLLSLLDRRTATDQEVGSALYASRVGEEAKKPSVEAIFHAYLLSLPGIEFVGHTHAPAVNRILCSPRAKEFAARRIFPDEVVCCGSESVFIPYTDPGLKLAQVIKKTTETYHKRKRIFPRVIVLQNHGIITIGGTTHAVLAAMEMAEKAASIWLGAAALGGPVFMTNKQVNRIGSRQDEEVRRRAMKL
jgi:rhamnose utilization protein RhaD (predicted bifunctional aldolase and dehydrogenase)